MSRKAGIILSAIIAIIAGLWVWAAVIPKDSIQIGGSTSVSNVMTNLENAYKTYQENNDKDKKPDQFIYSSVGSSGGINSAKSGTYKMGFISKNLDNSVSYVNESPDNAKLLSESIKERQKDIYDYFIESKAKAGNDDMHYFQIANDAIIIVYQAPKWFIDNYSSKFDITVTANGVSKEAKSLVQDIYKGHFKWSDVAKDLLKDPNAKIDTTDGGDAEVQPFAGAAGSGTRTVFDSVFGLTEIPDDQMVASVGPSDGFMYSSINANTIGYLSMNYLKQIQDNKKLHAVLVNGNNPKDKGFGVDRIKEFGDPSTYSLIRPYIGLIRAKSSDDDLKKLANFLGWIADASGKKESTAAQQYKSALIAPAFKLDDKSLLKGIKPDNKNKKSEVQTSLTNSELKENILNGYVRQD